MPGREVSRTESEAVVLKKRLAFRYSGLCDEAVKTTFYQDIIAALRQRYGSAGERDKLITNRVQEEWKEIVKHNSILDMAALYDICLWLQDNHLMYKITESPAGASFILYLLGVTRGNPLPPHIYNHLTGEVRYCPEYIDGFDIPQKELQLGSEWIADGHDIPWQSFFWSISRDNLLPEIKITIYADNIDIDELQLLTEHWSNQERIYKAMPLKVYKGEMKYIIQSRDNRVTDQSCRDGVIDFVSSVINDVKMVHYYLPDDDNQGILYILPKPQSFAEATKFYGIFRGIGVCNIYSTIMIEKFNMRVQIPAFIEDIYIYLLKHGFSIEEAWECAKNVNNRGTLSTLLHKLKNDDDFWLYQCFKSIYKAISKAEAVEELLFAAGVAND